MAMTLILTEPTKLQPQEHYRFITRPPIQKGIMFCGTGLNINQGNWFERKFNAVRRHLKQ